MANTIYRWYVALTKGGNEANKWLYEYLGCDDTKLHAEHECFNGENRKVKRNLYEVTRQELRTISASAKSLGFAFDVFVQEGNGNIRFFNPKAKRAEEKKPEKLAAVH